jgi:hypothetical protein
MTEKIRANERERERELDMLAPYHINIDTPLVCSLGIVGDNIFENGLPPFGLPQLELHLRELGGLRINVIKPFFLRLYKKASVYLWI